MGIKKLFDLLYLQQNVAYNRDYSAYFIKCFIIFL